MDLKDRVAETVTIPTLPEVAEKVAAMLADSEAGLKEIAGEIERDPPIAAKVIRIANSSYFAPQEPVLEVGRAVTSIGTRMLSTIVLQAAVIDRYKHLKDAPSLDLDALWQHSIVTAILARAIAEKAKGRVTLQPNEYYSCGLLHDIGRVVMLDSMEDTYGAVLQAAAVTGEPSHMLEKTELGVDHAEVGAVVADLWRLPRELGEAIRYHHGPQVKVAHNPIVAVVSYADQLARVICNEAAASLASVKPPAALTRTLGLGTEELRGVIALGRRMAATVEV